MFLLLPSATFLYESLECQNSTNTNVKLEVLAVVQLSLLHQGNPEKLWAAQLEHQLHD